MRNRGILAGAVVDGTDWDLPGIVTAYGNGTNIVTAASFAVLPTNTCSASITNDHPFASLLILVEYGAWMSAATGDVRATVSISGSVSSNAGISGSGPAGWGEVLHIATPFYISRKAACTYEIPASATPATVTMESYRVGSGVTHVDYPTIRIIPLRFVY
jgi:hypothetical protein